MRIPAYLLLAGLFASSSALAHGLWTEERRGNIEIVYGHGAEDDAFKAEKISGAWAYDAAGRMIPVTVERLADHARLQPLKKPAVLGVALDNGAWSKTRKANGSTWAAARWRTRPSRCTPTNTAWRSTQKTPSCLRWNT